jgi:hypothetical protein
MSEFLLGMLAGGGLVGGAIALAAWLRRDAEPATWTGATPEPGAVAEADRPANRFLESRRPR